jgi:hypothetical protein
VVKCVERRDHAQRFGGNAGLLGQFADGCVEQGFALVNLAAGKSPKARIGRIGATCIDPAESAQVKPLI